MTDPGLDPILAYLREHAGRFGVEPVRRRLLEAGYDPAAVDREVRSFRDENPPGLRERVGPKVWRVLQVNAWLAGAGIGLAYAPGVDGGVVEDIAFILLGILGAELLGGLVLAVPPRTRALGLALLAGFFLSTALGILILWAKIHLGSYSRFR